MKFVYIIIGVLLGVFGLVQLLFAFSLGNGYGIVNILGAVFGAILSYVCFRIAFVPTAKDAYIIAGVLFGLFSVAQFLQLFGFFGIGFSIAGVAFTILSGILAFLSFRKVFVVLK